MSQSVPPAALATSHPAESARAVDLAIANAEARRSRHAWLLLFVFCVLVAVSAVIVISQGWQGSFRDRSTELWSWFAPLVAQPLGLVAGHAFRRKSAAGSKHSASRAPTAVLFASSILYALALLVAVFLLPYHLSLAELAFWNLPLGALQACMAFTFARFQE
jgi:cation transport ATPase